MTRLATAICLILITLATVYVLVHAGEKPRLLVDEIVPVAGCPPVLGHFAMKSRLKVPMS